eukprot:TRINITY_DN51428_c0_g1_i1.p1 TRINITY_DN51428_c0_g1~~TRINITY_DN51428_c0_g1_i1.p1  ORF type:complete len:132 (+),score=32.25 TRINITY_DN51428_c0_g1_i1:213-608(+)
MCSEWDMEKAMDIYQAQSTITLTFMYNEEYSNETFRLSRSGEYLVECIKKYFKIPSYKKITLHKGCNNEEVYTSEEIASKKIKDLGFEDQSMILIKMIQLSFETVSYTHLTLPTILLVQISVVAVSLKKKQ